MQAVVGTEIGWYGNYGLQLFLLNQPTNHIIEEQFGEDPSVPIINLRKPSIVVLGTPHSQYMEEIHKQLSFQVHVQESMGTL